MSPGKVAVAATPPHTSVAKTRPSAPTEAEVAQPERVLRRGATGDDVRALQEKLAAAGYRVTADGVFGPRTEETVKRFQRSQGLAIDGAVGPITQGKLASPKPL
ncbi:MAG: peptidoglycan-binding domain-containing protein, partial [Myxococcota bacterium]